MSEAATGGTIKEANPWLENGQFSREKIRAYIQSENADMSTRLALGESAESVVSSQQGKIDSYLSEFSEADRMTFHTIYSQEFTSSLNASTLATKAKTQQMLDQQNAIKAGGYAVVAVITIMLIIFIVATRH